MKNLLYCFACLSFAAITLTSCSPKLTVTKNINSNSNLQKCDYILGKNENIPEDAIVVAEFKTKGTFFTSMNYMVNQSIDIVREGTNDLNYNIIKIEKINFPGPFKSKSYDLEGKFLVVNECPVPNGKIVQHINEGKKHIKLYRPGNFIGSGISYPVFLNEQFICALDNDHKVIIELSDSLTEAKLEIEVRDERFRIPLKPLSQVTEPIHIEVRVGGMGPKVTYENIDEGNKNFNKVKNSL